MSDTRISDLAELAESPADNDLIPGVDVSNTSMAASGTNVKFTGSRFYRPGRTDVAVADGGTGASTAADARTNLGVDYTTLDERARDAVGSALVAGEGIDITVSDGSDTITIDAELASDSNAGVVELATSAETVTGTDTARAVTPAGVAAALAKQAEVIVVAISDETTAITTGTAKVTFRMPFAMTLTAVRASLSAASSSGTPTFDINEAGSSVLSTKLTIDANELTSATAATAAVISDSALADDAEITIDVDVAGTGAKGAKVTLIGTRA